MKVLRTSKNIIISPHAQLRARQRANINGSALKNIANKAYELGIDFINANGELLHFIRNKYKTYQSANKIKVYGRFVYVFKNKFLITILELPQPLYSYWDEYSKQLKESF